MVKIEIDQLRKEYSSDLLDERYMDIDPFKQFSDWFNQTLKSGIVEPTAMFLATASKEGIPSGRVVLLKGFDVKGFVFFTNYNSRKGREINENPWVSVAFHWKESERQVRITGIAEKIADKESDIYFISRPFESQLSALVSRQSEVIRNREELEKSWNESYLHNKGKNLTRPETWGGYRITPFDFEFWQGRENRLHDRIRYKKLDNSWVIERLSP